MTMIEDGPGLHEFSRADDDDFGVRATCRRFSRRADLSARPSRVQRLGAITRARQFDGDKSPGESGENSKAWCGGVSRVRSIRG